jgi:hypothetical protein
MSRYHFSSLVALTIVLLLAVVTPSSTHALKNLVTNGGFDYPYNALWAWETNTATLNGIYHSYPRAAQLVNGKSMLMQRIWDSTPADCYSIFFSLRNALDQIDTSNSFEVEFNGKFLTGGGTTNEMSLPLVNTRLPPTQTGWVKYNFISCIPESEASETTELRIRFQGEGYLIDSIQVYPQSS